MAVLKTLNSYKKPQVKDVAQLAVSIPSMQATLDDSQNYIMSENRG